MVLNKEQVDSLDANEIHEKQSEETLNDIKARKMEKFSFLFARRCLPSPCSLILHLAYQVEGKRERKIQRKLSELRKICSI